MRVFLPTVATFLCLAGAPALAQQAAPAAGAQELKGAAAGATVYGPGDEAVATVESIEGNVAVLAVGASKVSVPLDRLGKGPNGPTIALGKAQLEALASQASAQASAQVKAKLAPGAEVHGSGGAVLGKVKAVSGSTVTITAASGKDVNVPASAIGATEHGLAIGMTAEQFEAAVKGAGQ